MDFSVSPTKHLFEQPISQRPSMPWRRMPAAIAFCVLFNFGCLMMHLSQLAFVMPLRCLPFKWSRNLYNKGIRYTKASFSCLCILMCQWLSPTRLVMTFETEGKGKVTQEQLGNIIVRNSAGEVEYLDLPTRFLLTSNHQIYADWLYMWCMTYFFGPHGAHLDIYITLKKSLKWVPLWGWAMQLFGFIFLARSWASDRIELAKHLSVLGKKAEDEDDPFCLLLYPEGTLVSKLTRPISKNFANKNGIVHPDNTLLPRSTGLHYSLRVLAPRMPDLRVIDLTVIYPGIPPQGYGQDYYTLRSIFVHGVPPPVINVHVRIFDVATDIPIGNGGLPTKTTSASNGRPAECTAEVEILEEEKQEFDLWLRELWDEKDQFITKSFSEDGSGKGRVVADIPLRLHRKREYLAAFGHFLPLIAGYMCVVIRRYVYV